ncbi:hypothetical protein [Rhodohalobacter halophilus]|uniref:hypothetical protein n=1 Tax=Rhodohalobacter halophilus TaxID=1812810 RepID=UPI00114CA0D1|nr:hypothetical protein [Rhodohalobacter halophilus]
MELKVDMRTNRYTLFAIFLLMLFVNSRDSLHAQQSSGFATLIEWEQRTLNFMLDRSHNFGATHYNRGLFRRTINPMSPEHEIDLLTYRYTYLDDYRWHTADQAYRLSVGSLNATNFAIENKIKMNYRPGDRHLVKVDGFHEENLRTDRFLFRLGYEYQLKNRHQIGAEHTLSRDKSDLDITLYYKYGDIENGMIYAGFTWMDWGAGVVQDLAEGSDNEWNDRYELVYEYGKHPFLYNIKIVSPEIGNFKAEILAGIQTKLEKEVRSTSDPGQIFSDEEWAHYLGALAQYSHPFGLIGVTYQRRFSKLIRQPVPGSDFIEDFSNRQYSDRGGFFVTGTYRNFSAEQWMWLERNVDSLQGETVPGDLAPNYSNVGRQPFHFVEQRLKMKSRILYGSDRKGIQLGLEFHADYRYPEGDPHPDNGVRNLDFRRVYPTVRNRNDRLTFTIGYRVNEKFHFLAGVSYDIDQDKQSGIGYPREPGSRFDGGFGRLSVEW